METKSSEGNTLMQWIVLIVADFTVLTYGFQAGWISPMSKFLQSDQSPTGRPVTDTELSWMASLLCFSAIFGATFFAFLSDKLGRKISIITMAMAQTISWIIKLAMPSVPGLFAARICSGFAAGGIFNVIPMYTKELSQDDIRGTLGALVMLSQNIGIFTMYALGAYLNYFTVIWILMWFPILTIVFLVLKGPESPNYLVHKGNIKESIKTLAFLRGLNEDHKIISEEVEKMKNDDNYYKSLPKISFISIFKNKAWRRSFFFLMTIITVQAFSGNFAILTYATSILTSAGANFSPELQALSLPIVSIVGSFGTMNCVERFGRKPILYTTYVVTSVALAGLASILFLTSKGIAVPSWLAILLLISYILGYSSGVQPLPYIIMSESTNFQVRAKAMGCLVSFAWFISFMQLVSYIPVSNALGIHVIFYCYAGINFMGLMFTYFLVPETKGKSIDEIEYELGKK